MIEIHLSELLAAAGIFLFVLLCLNRILFSPATRVLEERRNLTAGRLEEAEQLLRRCEELTQEYETRIRTEKFQGYRIQDQRRAEALARSGEVLEASRRQADQMIAEAKTEMLAQVETVKAGLQTEARDIAATIRSRILGHGAS